MDAERFAKMLEAALKGRPEIKPDNLPPFGARVTTEQGHVCEVLGWYGPAPGPEKWDRERMAVALLIEAAGAVPVPREGTQMMIMWFYESNIASFEAQPFPRFATWVRNVAISSAIGRAWE